MSDEGYDFIIDEIIRRYQIEFFIKFDSDDK